jgi:hypothetical protein
MMDLKVDFSNLDKVGKEFPRASSRALNKTMKHVRTRLVKDAGQRYKVKAGDLKSSIGEIHLAKPTRLSTFFRSKGKRIALTYFMTKSNVMKSLAQIGKKVRRRANVTIEVTKGARRIVPGAFVAEMKSGHQGVFTREQGVIRGLPIKERTGPALPQMVSGAWSRMKDVHEYLIKTLQHEIEWFRSGKGGL